MARALPRLLLPVFMAAAGCGQADDGAAAGAPTDTTRQGAAPPAARDTAQAREAVLRVSDEFGRALMRGDSAAFGRILAEDYVGVSMDGHSETKAQALAKVRGDSAALAGGTLQSDSVSVRVHGDAAVVRTSGTLQVRSGPRPGALRFRTTDVFVWRDGRWQVLASHVSRVAEPQGR